MVAQTNFETSHIARDGDDGYRKSSLRKSVQICVAQPVCPSWTLGFLLPHSVPHGVVSQQKLDSRMKDEAQLEAAR